LLQDLGLRKFSRRPLPYKFTISQEQKRVIKAREILKSLREHVDPNFVHIMIANDGWFFYGYDPNAMLAKDRADIVPRVSQMMGSKKAMITIFVNDACRMTLKYLPRSQKHNTEYLVNTSRDGFNTSWHWTEDSVNHLKFHIWL
jgi:hypothetical protein